MLTAVCFPGRWPPSERCLGSGSADYRELIPFHLFKTERNS